MDHRKSFRLTTSHMNEETFWVTNPPHISPFLQPFLRRIEWLDHSFRNSKFLIMQMLHINLAMRHTLYHLAKEFDVDELIILDSDGKIECFSDLLVDWEDCVKGVVHITDMNDVPTYQDTLDLLFKRLCDMVHGGSSEWQTSPTEEYGATHEELPNGGGLNSISSRPNISFHEDLAHSTSSAGPFGTQTTSLSVQHAGFELGLQNAKIAMEEKLNPVGSTMISNEELDVPPYTPRVMDLDPSRGSTVAESSSQGKGKAHITAASQLDTLANLAEASDILSPLKAAARATRSILDVIQAADDNQEEWADLAQRLEEYMSSVESTITTFESYPQEERVVHQAFSQPLIRYVELLEQFHGTVAHYRHKRSRLGALTSLSKTKVDAGSIRKFNRDIEDRHRQFMEALTMFAAFRIQVVEQHTKAILTEVDALTMIQLPIVASVASSMHRTCLPGTRQTVLRILCRWAEDDLPQRPIFWLSDIAGSGKSTVAMSMVEIWRESGLLGGHFFFCFTTSEGSTTDKFCSTIARDLAHNIPELAPHIATALKRNPSIMRRPLNDQFRTLVSGPLQYRKRPVILVIDAVDECKSGSQRKELLETLSAAAQETMNLKIFITSRPDTVIEAVLKPISIRRKLENRLHGTNHRDNINDIAVYVHQSLDGVLSQEKRQHLITKASGWFIWASSACRMLKDEKMLENPQRLYDRLITGGETEDIGKVYNSIFWRIEPKYHTNMWNMLSVIAAVFEPLTTDDLDDLMGHIGVGGSAIALINALGGIIAADSTTSLIHFCHPTLVEYLRQSPITQTHSRDEIYIDIANAHGQIASWCFKNLTSRVEGLKFNICEIESSFYLNQQVPDLAARVSRFIPRKLRYASSHWLHHMAKTNSDWQKALKYKVRHIVRSPYVLYWMEILSVTGGVARAISGLRALTLHGELEMRTRRRILDIHRFMMEFSLPIQQSAPHIYISALPFTPTESQLRVESLKNCDEVLVVSRGLRDTYPVLPTILRGHKGGIYALAISSDGSRIASGSSDNTIRVWDADTGQPLGEQIQGHKSSVTAIAFSPDNLRIVSGSNDNTLRLWDADTGQGLGEPLRGHVNSVNAVAFYPDSSRIISGSSDNTIRLWDAESGQPVGVPLLGHGGAICALALSPDGSRIVSGSDDQTMRLWDAGTGQPLGSPLRGHEDSVLAVAFSPDGSQIISGSADETVRLWDAETGFSLEEPLRGHEGWINTVSFSLDGSQIISGSEDTTIRLWEAETGELLGQPLQGHKDSVFAVTISPERSRIVSGSGDGTIRLWDLVTGQPLGDPLQGHNDLVNSVAFSLKNSRIVSGSADGSLRLWDAETSKPLGDLLRGHKGSVLAVAFSSDGSRIVSGSEDRTIRIWDLETGQISGAPLEGHEGWVEAVAFSLDGSLIASGSRDNTIRIWDVENGQLTGEPLRGHESSVSAVAFSPDGSQIVSGSYDRTVRLWDVQTGRPLGQPLRGHESGIDTVVFSSDGSRIISSSGDETVRIWDARTGQQLEERYNYPVSAISLWSNDQISGQWDEQIGQ
ncbi:WD repeat-containing protein tag-125 [Serendipita indica DSM 11827]|nr:WD repeat-containing protein tag-125 [Serendipita indica DSM 11827]